MIMYSFLCTCDVMFFFLPLFQVRTFLLDFRIGHDFGKKSASFESVPASSKFFQHDICI